MSHDDAREPPLTATIELMELAEGLLRQRLRRAHPDASEQQIERWVTEWYEQRPGAEHGDAEGRPGTWPRGA